MPWDASALDLAAELTYMRLARHRKTCMQSRLQSFLSACGAQLWWPRAAIWVSVRRGCLSQRAFWRIRWGNQSGRLLMFCLIITIIASIFFPFSNILNTQISGSCSLSFSRLWQTFSYPDFWHPQIRTVPGSKEEICRLLHNRGLTCRVDWGHTHAQSGSGWRGGH